MHTSWERRNKDEDGLVNSIREISPMVGQLFYSLMTGKNMVIIIMSLTNWPELICRMTKKVIKGGVLKVVDRKMSLFLVSRFDDYFDRARGVQFAIKRDEMEMFISWKLVL